ncbi:MAG: hypothetical protein ACPGXK_13655, partial [Phycisphaerae bacterium]
MLDIRVLSSHFVLYQTAGIGLDSIFFQQRGLPTNWIERLAPPDDPLKTRPGGVNEPESITEPPSFGKCSTPKSDS